MSDCIPWTKAIDKHGYGQTKRKNKNQFAHRLAYVDAHGLDIEDIKGLVVRHKCDNPICVNPDHLELGTFGDNNRDTVRRGRYVATNGSRHHAAKLKEEYIPVIRQRLANGETSKQIAATYGVSKSLIDFVRQGKIWKHVPL